LVAVGAVGALGSFPGDHADQATAHDLGAHGIAATATSSRVHVHHVPSKGGGYYEVDDVEVHLPGRSSPVRLQGALGPGFGGDIEFATERAGWQTPTEASGYASPLQIEYRVTDNGLVVAMAERDLQYWLASKDSETDLRLGGLAATLLLASVVPASVRARRVRHRAG